MFSTASDLGFDGIEIRGVADQIYAPKITAFSNENLPKTLSELKRTNLSFPILTSGAYLCGNSDISDALFEVKDYVMLASRLGAKNVRVLGESGPDCVIENPDIDSLVKNYTELCDFAKPFGINILIETNGFLANSNVMRSFMEKCECENAGIIWDIHHTYRFFGEDPEYTVNNLSPYIRHVHVKDSVKGRNGKITYMLTGYGDIPTEEAYKALSAKGYDGFWSYEWVKRWSRELAEPGVAFYQYITYMRGLE